jgi:hypothetical protein
LSPRSASNLLAIEDAVRAKLAEGEEYARWNAETRFAFVKDVLALLSQVPSFRISTKLGRKQNFTDWSKPLRWWLAKSTLKRQPLPREITSWYDFVAQNFVYRGAWGLGSIIGLLIDASEDGQPVRALEIADWPRSGLPWIAFWMKELITWGTLDPVAAFLLARGEAVDRPQAEDLARAYYDELANDGGTNSVLDPRRIRDWVDARRARPEQPVTVREFAIEVSLVRPPEDYRNPRLTVVPIDVHDSLTWIDPAGYTVARSEKPFNWPETPASFDFELVVQDQQVVGEAYLRHV